MLRQMGFYLIIISGVMMAGWLVGGLIDHLFAPLIRELGEWRITP